jgi:hypothetical protein
MKIVLSTKHPVLKASPVHGEEGFFRVPLPPRVHPFEGGLITPCGENGEKQHHIQMLQFSKEMLNNELIAHGVFTPAPVVPNMLYRLNRYCYTIAIEHRGGFQVTGTVPSLIVAVLSISD